MNNALRQLESEMHDRFKKNEDRIIACLRKAYERGLQEQPFNVEAICRIWTFAVSYRIQVDGLPYILPANKRREQLSQIVDALNEMLQVYDELPTETVADLSLALLGSGQDPERIFKAVRGLQAAAREAVNTNSGQLGRRGSRHIRLNLIRQLGSIFREVTGFDPATERGKAGSFRTFVGPVFEIIGIHIADNSIDDDIRDALAPSRPALIPGESPAAF